MTFISPDKWEDFWQYYNPKLEQHRKAIRELYKLQNDEALELDAEWMEIYREPSTYENDLVSKQQLAGVWQCSVDKIEDEEIVELNECLRKYEITTVDRIQHFLAQTAHESGGGRYKVEIHDGSNYEFRSDLGNVNQGDGIVYAGSTYGQITGRYNYQRLADHLKDPKVMEGKYYTGYAYPFTGFGFWWDDNNMNELIDNGATCDEVGARVNGRMPPNGAEDRLHYYELACIYIE